MGDTRFTTMVDDTEELLSIVDVDEIGDVETLLMFLLARPVGVTEAWDVVDGTTCLEVVIHGSDGPVGSNHDYPLSVLGLARSCAQTADELGPYASDDSEADTPGVLALDDEQLVVALQSALGKVRVFNLMDWDA